MPGGPLRQIVLIRNPEGFHIRPMAAFAEATKRFHCRVTLTYLDRHIEDATELMNLFPLVAPLGAEVLLEVEGADADAALPVLAGILGALDALPEPAPPVGPSS